MRSLHRTFIHSFILLLLLLFLFRLLHFRLRLLLLLYNIASSFVQLLLGFPYFVLPFDVFLNAAPLLFLLVSCVFQLLHCTLSNAHLAAAVAAKNQIKSTMRVCLSLV